MRLEGKVAVVTGAANGIGRQIAQTLAGAGAKLAISDLDRAGADVAAAQINDQGGQAIAVGMDVTSEAQVDSGMAQVAAEFGRIDILVSNAGIQIVAPLEDF